MPPVGFEPTISAGERPQTCALDRAATGTGGLILLREIITVYCKNHTNYEFKGKGQLCKVKTGAMYRVFQEE